MTDADELERRHGLSPFVIDGIELKPGFAGEESSTSFVLTKSHVMVEYYRSLLPEYERGRIVELGVWRGGSVVMLALMAAPTKLVSLELSTERLEHLDEFLTDRRLSDSVRPIYGVDQGDVDRVSAIVDAEFGDEQLDLVVDDASHRYSLTLASFEVLFGRLRPGGVYMIEDWNSEHMLADYHPPDGPSPLALDPVDGVPPTPLSRLAVELLLVRASAGDLIRSVEVTEHFVTVRRGLDPLPPGPFRLADHYIDYFGNLPALRQ